MVLEEAIIEETGAGAEEALNTAMVILAVVAGDDYDFPIYQDIQ
jgi:hypothetical protein